MKYASHVLRRFLLGFEGTRLPRDLREMLQRGLAGVAIFRRNWSSVEELRALTDEIRAAAAPRHALIGIDHEGGTKFSLPEPFTRWPSPAELGRLDDRQAVEGIARAIARELLAAGCNLNFAPMLDLHVNPDSPVTQHRSFGGDPQRVGAMGAAVIRGLGAEGVLSCAKHFPGHGDAVIDPHEDLPVFHGDAARLNQMELSPFAAAIAAGAPLIMTAHILLPKIDAARPASLSRAMLHDTLRRKMNFQGVVLIDDIGMGAIGKRHAAGEAAVLAIEAGTDLVAICHDASAVAPALTAVQRAHESFRFDDVEWGASNLRIERLLSLAEGGMQPGRFTRPPLDVIGCPAHRELAAATTHRLNHG